MTEEIWRPVPGYEGSYEVSSLGRVRGVDRIVEHKQGPLRRKGKLLALGRQTNGYLLVVLAKNGVGRTHLVHRLVALVFHGNPQDGQQVLHRDGDRTNAAADNLMWGTALENAADKRRHGTQPLGEAVHLSKLTNEQAAQALIDRRSRRIVARELGVSESTIKALRTGRNWQWLHQQAPV